MGEGKERGKLTVSFITRVAGWGLSVQIESIAIGRVRKKQGEAEQGQHGGKQLPALDQEREAVYIGKKITTVTNEQESFCFKTEKRRSRKEIESAVEKKNSRNRPLPFTAILMRGEKNCPIAISEKRNRQQLRKNEKKRGAEGLTPRRYQSKGPDEEKGRIGRKLSSMDRGRGCDKKVIIGGKKVVP